MFDFKQRYQQITTLIQRYQEVGNYAAELSAENEQYKAQRAELFQRFGSRYGTVQAGEARIYTAEELTQIRLELANSAGLWALLKSMLGFGKSQKDVYLELMSKLTGLLDYMESQIQDCHGEAAAIMNKLYELSDEYSLAYRSVKRFSGCNGDSDWTSYEMPESLENERIFLGDFLKPMLPEGSPLFAGDERGLLFAECREDNYLSTPWGFMLSNPIQLCIDYDNRTAIGAQRMLQSIIYQILRNIPQYYMEFSFMDAVASGDGFKDFIRLQQVKKNDVVVLNRKVTGGNYQLARSFLKSEDIGHALTAMRERMTTVVNEKAPHATVAEYNAEKGMDAWIPYQVIIADNLHEGYSDTDMKNLQYLIENGRSLGAIVILMNNTERWSDDSNYRKTCLEDCLSPEALGNLVRITLDKDGSEISARGIVNEFRFWQTGDAHPEFIQKVVAALGSEKKLDNEFQRIFNINDPFGQMDSSAGLTIPFAINQRGDLMSYTLGQALNAHGLICGGTGSGKSSLLHMLISSIVMNYTPDDVELWLADYKITEFYSYKTNTPPHIRFIGLSKTSDFSYAFLDKIVEEMNRRQDLIAQADHQYKLDGGKNNITSFADYRKINGKTSMRRLLIIIDEFHVMSQHAQLEQDYKTKLENILSEARALGIILLLSDQAIVDGLRGLSDKGKKQIKARIALSNYMDELKETLNVHDTDQLKSFVHMNVGEVAVQTVKENEDREEVATIERATAIYINGTARYSVNEKARDIYDAQDYVSDVFDDRVVEPMKLDEIEDWESKNLSVHRDGSKDLYMYLGKPVNLEFAQRFPLLQRKGNNMMCVSGTEEQQMRVLNAIVSSFSRADNYEVRILADSYAGVYREYRPEIREFGRIHPEIEVYEDLGEICHEVDRLCGYLKNRGNQKKCLVVWLGLDAMADILAEEKSTRPQWDDPRAMTQDQIANAFRIPEQTPEPEEEKDDALSMLDSLFGDDIWDSEESEPESAPPAEAEPTWDFSSFQEQPSKAMAEPPVFEEEPRSDLYDARSDIAKLIHLGPTCNVFNLVIYDSASALRDFREVRTSDFNHKIAFPMSEYEAGEFLDQPRLIRELASYLGYYHNGRKGSRFIPYKL